MAWRSLRIPVDIISSLLGSCRPVQLTCVTLPRCLATQRSLSGVARPCALISFPWIDEVVSFLQLYSASDVFECCLVLLLVSDLE